MNTSLPPSGNDSRSSLSQFVIEPPFSTLLPPLDDAVRDNLKSAILSDGRARDPITVGRISGLSQPVLVDGHQRLSIIAELRNEGHGIPDPEVVLRDFESGAEAIAWMVSNQNARRVWEAWDRARVVIANKPAIEELQARARKNEGAGRTLSSAKERVHVDEELARLANVSKNTIHRARLILEHGGSELVGRLDQPQSGSRPSITSAYHAAKSAKRERENAARRSRPQPPIPEDDGSWSNQLLCGDAREILKRIPDNEATLYVFSPPYPLPDRLIGYDVYRYPGFEQWLGELKQIMEEAFRTLRIGGRVAINIDVTNDREEDGSTKFDIHYWVSSIMKEIGFEFMDEIVWFKQNNSGQRPSFGTYMSPKKPNIRRNHEYVLIYYKETPHLDGDEELSDINSTEFHQSTMSTWNFDPANSSAAGIGSFWYVKSETRNGSHPCPYPLKLPEMLIKLLSRREDLVVDPYSGSGTTCLAAMLSGRRYVGIDLSAAYTVAAKARLEAAAKESDDAQGDVPPGSSPESTD